MTAEPGQNPPTFGEGRRILPRLGITLGRMKPNQRVSSIAFSATLALDARAKELRAAGRDIVNLTAGEPDFDTPASVREAAKASIDSGKVRYTPAAGRPSLRDAIAAHLSETRGTTFTRDQITVCHSCKHAISGTLSTLVEPGDEVLVPLPAWVSYFEIIKYTGGIPVGVEPDANCAPNIAALEAAVTPKTRGIMLNSPSNPSGVVYSEDDVRAICELAKKHDLWILSDEIYRRLVYSGAPAFSPTSVSDDARARTIIVDGASKAYAMTGYRIGFLAGSPEIASSVARLHSQLTGSPCAVSQDAYEAALVTEPVEVEGMVAEFSQRSAHIVKGLRALGLEVPEPRGAFYAFPNVAAYLDERGSTGFCEDLLNEKDLALVPGGAFGLDEHVRLSYASSIETIDIALARLGSFLESRTAKRD